MDFTIDRADLLAAIDKCALAVPDPKHPTEVFRVMTVDATKKKTVRLAAIGEYCTVDTVSKAEIKASGAFNVYPKHLRDIASSMPPGRIQLSMKGTRVTVKSLVSSRKATFEHHGVDIKPVDDPGKSAAWQQIDSQELVRVLKMVKSASTWHDRNDPVVSLLIPTERGLDVFGCNGYLIALVESSIPMTSGEPVMMPATAVAVLLLMAPDDARLKLFSDGRRVYLENADTLVSAALPPEYSPSAYPHLIALLKDKANVVGPSFELAPMQAGARAVLSLAGFAGDSEKKGQRGYRLEVGFGGTITVELGFSSADAKDEFEATNAGDKPLQFGLSSLFFDQMLSSLVGVDQVQALRADNMLVLRSAGVLAGIMEERPL